MIGGTAVGAICTLLGSWIKARFGRTRIEPQPLEVENAPRYVTCEQCQQNRHAFDNQLSDFRHSYDIISAKLDRIEDNNEERAKRLHDRLDPLVKSAASTADMLSEHLKDHRSGVRK